MAELGMSRVEAETVGVSFSCFCFVLYALVFYLHVCLCEGVGSPGTGVTDSCEVLCG